jgi:hypothetical protein
METEYNESHVELIIGYLKLKIYSDRVRNEIQEVSDIVKGSPYLTHLEEISRYPKDLDSLLGLELKVEKAAHLDPQIQKLLDKEKRQWEEAYERYSLKHGKYGDFWTRK